MISSINSARSDTAVVVGVVISETELQFVEPHAFTGLELTNFIC
jgi:hypothetical protein